MDLDKIKILKIDITDWLIDAIYNSKEHPDKSKNVFTFNRERDIVEFELKHEDFDFNIDFNIYEPNNEGDYDCEFKNYSHVSDLYPDSEMIDFDDNRSDEIYRAVLSHF